MTLSSGRNEYLDALKGVGIILMVIGHVQSPIRDFIFSFHMPLFFFISGYLFKDRDSTDILKRNWKKVLIPYLLTCIAIWLFMALLHKYTWGLSIFLANGSESVWGFEGYSVGPLWFLVCYSVSLLLFHYLLKIRSVDLQLCSLIGFWVLAYLIKQQFGLQPLGLLNAIPACFCLWMGYITRSENARRYLLSPYSISIGLCIWILCLWRGSVSMASFVYKLWFLQIVGAYYATWLIYKAIITIKKLSGGVFIRYWKGQFALIVCTFGRLYV